MSSSIRRTLCLGLTTTVVLTLLAPGATARSTDPSPVDQPAAVRGQAVREQPVAGEETGTEPFRMVGVTWPTQNRDVVAKVRVRQGGTWSAWQTLDAGDDNTAPDGRSGTDPLWVDRADGVEASVTSGGQKVPDSKVVLVDPGTRAEDEPGRLDAASEGADAGTEARPAPYPMPRIVTRRGWGADESRRGTNGAACTRPAYTGTVRVAVVHHTAGSNGYAANQSAALVRSIYAYHVKGRGWCDIGYNFLVDRYGRIFEGRAGGMPLPVRGAHAGGGFNTNTFGVSLMGSFDKQAPPATMMAATARVIAWKLDANYRGPYSKQRINGKLMNAISGHRDAKATECPGRFVYARLPGLRKLVSSLMGKSVGTEIHDRAQRMGGERRIGPPWWGEHVEGGGRATWFGRADIYWSPATGAHALTGAFRNRYRLTGHGTGPLGYPLEERHAARIRGAQVQHFRRPDGSTAALYWSPATGAREVYGVIMKRYAGLGAERSRLRLPVSAPYPITGGVAQTFQGGRITWKAPDGAATVDYR